MNQPIDRRSFAQLLAAGSACFALRRSLGAEPEKSMRQTYTYKTVGSCAIQADVYGASSSVARPVVVWIHGGALIMGNRGGFDARLRDRVLHAGYVLVSIDYRLAPETKLPAILEDVEDACRWVRREGPKLFHADPRKVAVMGGSAGGYLTLTTGYRVEPRPAALVSLWGYGDIVGPWYSRPDAFYRRQPLVSKEEAYRVVGGPVLTDSSGKNERGRFYLYCRQNGRWPVEVTGHDPDQEPRFFEPYCPVKNVSARYPPTLLVHGTSDTDVPYQLSVDMARELERKGVEHELVTIRDGGHGLSGVKPEVVAKTYDHVIEFLTRHLR
jgi:acetyl esterase/lipase